MERYHATSVLSPNSTAPGAGGAHAGHGLQWSAALPEAPV